MILFRAPQILDVRSESEAEVGKKINLVMIGDLAMTGGEQHGEYIVPKRNRTASGD